MVELIDVVSAFAVWVVTCGACLGILIYAAWPKR